MSYDGLMDAVIYTRISFDKTGKEAGVTRQRTECKRLAETLGWNVVEVFEENDASATKARSRPVFARMLEVLDQGSIQGLLFWHPDRAYRTLIDLDELIQVSKRHGIQIRTVMSGAVDLSTASGIMTAEILASVAKHEVARVAERQKSAKADRAAKGLPGGGGRRRFGYSRSGMEIVPEEADLIRKGVEAILEGRTKQSIAQEWNKTGMTTVMGSRWTSASVHRVLTASHIAGLQKFHGEITGRGVWEPIVDEDVWNVVNSILIGSVSPRQHSVELNYQGSGCYLCGKCGRALRPCSQRGTRFYRCLNRDLSISMASTDAFIKGVVVAWASNYDVNLMQSEPLADVSELMRMRAVLESRLTERVDMFDLGELTREQFNRSSERIRSELKTLTSRISRELDRSAAAQLLEEDDIETAWDGYTAVKRRAVIDELMTVTVLPVPEHGKRNRDPWVTAGERLQIEWK